MYKIHKLTPIILSVFMPFISSCSDDDDNQGGGNNYRQDAIVESILVNGRTCYQFEYDEQGNISAVSRYSRRNELTLNGDQLIILGDYHDAICSISGGRISNIYYDDEYEYNNHLKYTGNHLSKGDFYYITWNGNQIVKTIENENGYDIQENSYEYSDLDNNANIDFNIIVSQMEYLVDDEDGWIVSAIGLTGTRTDKLISKETIYYNEDGDYGYYSYDYDVDAQQRVIKITKTRNGNIYNTYEVIYSGAE